LIIVTARATPLLLVFSWNAVHLEFVDFIWSFVGAASKYGRPISFIFVTEVCKREPTYNFLSPLAALL